MKKSRLFPFILLFIVSLNACSKRIIPEKPDLAKTYFSLDTLPVSEIDVPLQINLKPFYDIADKNVQKTYASEGWPHEFIVDNCDTRYMYRFKRGPLRIAANGNTISFNFTGSYIIAGAQRICTGTGSDRVAITPWTPTCTCGLNEAEPRVDIGYKASLQLKPDYNITAKLQPLEPKPLDKCTVCFWKHDITPTVMKQLKEQLKDAGKEIEDSINGINLRPRFQQLWDILNTGIRVYDMGYLKINPEKIRLSTLHARNDSLNVSVGISARPLISLTKNDDQKTVVPDISDFGRHSGFSVYVDAIMDYDSLSMILTRTLKGKRINMDKVGKYIIIDKCSIYGADNEKLIIKIQFTGSETGVMYLTGKPVFDKEKNNITVKQIDFDVKTRDLLIKTAKWLFNRRIINELNKYASFDIQGYTDTLLLKVSSAMNREWQKGISSSGKVNDLRVINIYPFKNVFILRCNAKGDLSIRIDEIAL